jgi:CheY-like chemotaxis protein
MPIPILVADSNREFGILIRQALEESGRFEVSLASSAEDAVALSKDVDFTLAIIDFALPDLDGEEIVERIRALQPGMAVIAIPVGEDEGAEKIRRAGVDGLLTKPFYLPNLPDIIEEALGSRLDFHRPQPLPMPSVAPPPPAPSQPEPPPQQAADRTRRDLSGPAKAPPWLLDIDRAAQYLARLTLETSAEAALLIRHRELVAFAGQLPRSQVQALTAQVADSWAEEGRTGAVARFVHLPGTADDFMLYATGVVSDMVLSLVFSAEIPFGMIRRQAEALAHALSEVDPAHHTPESSTVESSAPEPREASPGPPVEPSPTPDTLEHSQGRDAGEPTTDHDAPVGPSRLPEDWIPRPSRHSRNAKLLDELATLELPEPDPEEDLAAHVTIVATQPKRSTPDLPLDWLPVITHSRRHLPFLEEPGIPEPEPFAEADTLPPAVVEQETLPTEDTVGAAWHEPSAEVDTHPPAVVEQATLPTEDAEEGARDEPDAPHPVRPSMDPDRRLPYIVVFAPRFPEHRLAGPVVESLAQWTRRLCVARDWKAERIEVSHDTLLVQIRLPADVAPAGAVQELSDHLSEQVFEAFPHLKPGVSTGSFWASSNLLISGQALSRTEIAVFITELRQAQGLGE